MPRRPASETIADATERAWRAHLPAGVERAAVDVLGSHTLVQAWAARWEAVPSAVAFIADGGARALTYGELDDRSRDGAGRLRAAGLAPGDRLLFSAGNSVELAVAHVAALRAGLVVVPANTAYRERELRHIVEDARPAAAVVDDAERAAWLQAAGGPALRVVGPELDLPGADAGPIDEPGPDAPALIGYTSGTTGAPKGAVLTHANLLAGSASVGLAWRWDAADRLVLCLPMFHAHGLCVGLHGTLLAGASAVLLPAFSVDAVLDAAAAHRASLFFGVPTMYQRLAASPRAGELAALRLCVSGSAPLPAELHERIAASSGQRVLERYGMTETLMNISNPVDGDRRPGSVGLPLPGVEVRLDETASGEILLRGPNVFQGYWRNPAASAAAFTTDGFFRSGDLAEYDDDGYVRILGRARELVITGGFNVYPREVEEVLTGHPAIVEAAVVGEPDDEWGEVVTAYVVVPDGRLDEAELRAFCDERLAPYKRPRRVRLVDQLPRNTLGKVLKHELRPDR